MNDKDDKLIKNTLSEIHTLLTHLKNNDDLIKVLTEKLSIVEQILKPNKIKVIGLNIISDEHVLLLTPDIEVYSPIIIEKTDIMPVLESNSFILDVYIKNYFKYGTHLYKLKCSITLKPLAEDNSD